jgi:TonB family protein
MFEQLIESSAHRQPGFGQTVLSMAIHAGIFCGAVTFTRSAATPPVAIPADTMMIWMNPSTARFRNPIPAHVLARGFSTPIVPAVDVPNHFPVVVPGPSYLPIDPRSVFGNDRGTTRGVDTMSGVGTGPGFAEDVYLAAEVDEAPERVAGAQCSGVYPSGFKSAGIEGTVVLQFVVNQNGRVEAGSVRVVESPMPAFATAAEEGLLGAGCHFKPGRSRGQPVRVLVQQPIAFRINR